MRTLYVLFLLAGSITAQAQPKTDAYLQKILLANTDSLFREVLYNPATYRLQIIYTQINRDKNNKPAFKNYHFNVDPFLYFNPASTVKLPLAALSLEKLNRLDIPGVDKYTRLRFDSAYPRQVKAVYDSTAETYYPSIAHYIKKVFLISDNDAYNRLYQFVGQQTINRSLHAKGYKHTRITRQFMGFTDAENRRTNPVDFIDAAGRVIYHQPMQTNTDSFDFSRVVRMGKAHYNNQDSLINEPIDFTRVNNLPVEDFQQILQSILFPLSVPEKQRFDLKKDDYDFLKKFLSQYPSETDYPKYDTAQYYDSYVKFFFHDSTHAMPPNIRVFNKVGWAYGFLIDASYVVDFENKVEFMLASVIYANSDGILNDDKYDLETVAYPFTLQLGQTIYRHELQRKRRYQPNLSDFRISYDKRNPADGRPSIKNADN